MQPDSGALTALSCSAGAPKLQAAELIRRVAELPGWECAGDRLAKTFRFADYYETIAFVNAVAWLAHREDHHPDLSVHFNRVVVNYSTHDAGGITLNDCICAAKVDALGA